jgi:plasmid stabilization system protein ParE
VSDFAEIIGHIAEDDAEAASRFGSSLLDHIDLLTRFPRMGGTVPKRRRVRKLFTALC